MGLLFRQPASPSLTESVRNRLRPPGIVELDTTVLQGASIAQRAIDWLESGDSPDRPEWEPELSAWKERVLRLARKVRDDDESQLVSAVSNLLVTELGWQDGHFAGVAEEGLDFLCDEESPDLGPLLDAALSSAAGVPLTGISDIPERVRSLLFERTGQGYDFRQFQGRST
jgi:hypothetical protein